MVNFVLGLCFNYRKALRPLLLLGNIFACYSVQYWYSIFLPGRYCSSRFISLYLRLKYLLTKVMFWESLNFIELYKQKKKFTELYDLELEWSLGITESFLARRLLHLLTFLRVLGSNTSFAKSLS